MQTNQHRASETALRASAALMLEHAHVAMALVEARTLRFVAVTPSFDALLPLSWQHGHALGHPLTEVLPPAVTHRCLDGFQHVMKTASACQLGLPGWFTGPEERGAIWQWVLHPVVEHGHVASVVVTLTEVTEQGQPHHTDRQKRLALTQTQHPLPPQEHHQRHNLLERLLLSVQGLSDPRAVAEAILRECAGDFSTPLLALYHACPAQNTLVLLASYQHHDFPHLAPTFPRSLASAHGGSLVEALQHHVPLIENDPQEGKAHPKQGRTPDFWQSLAACGQVISVPLQTQQDEDVLLLVVPRHESISAQSIQELWACTPFMAEIFARARLYAALADERQHMHLLLNQLPEGVIVVEARTSRVRYANAEAAHLLGCADSTLIGTPLNRLATHSRQASPDLQPSIPRWEFVLIDALWGKTVTNQEMSMIHADGTEVIVLCSTATLRTFNGLITDAVMVLQDMTAIKQVERQKNEFFAVANHELRTPLTTILGWIELLDMTRQQNADPRYQKAISSIKQEGEILRQLLQDLLDVARLEEGHLMVNKRRQELLVPLRELVGKYAHASSIHQIRFTLDDVAPESRLEGEVDLLRLEQIVTNVLTNAIKYSPDGGNIEVGVQPQRDAQGSARTVLIWVKDQGIGIAEKDLSAIFERFYRAHSFQQSSLSGFGIGLYLARKLVQAHGGRIWVESVQQQGSTFFIALPLDSVPPHKLSPE